MGVCSLTWIKQAANEFRTESLLCVRNAATFWTLLDCWNVWMRVSASYYVQNDNVDVTFLKVREESKVKPRSFVVEFGTKKWHSMHAFLPTFELLFSSPHRVRMDLITGVTLLSHTLIHKHMHTLWSEGWFVQFVGISPCIAAGGSPASTLQRKKKKSFISSSS